MIGTKNSSIMTIGRHPQVLATTICGALHRAKRLPCQDYASSKIKGHKLVAVVSDGAGSAKYGKTGAKAICDTLCDILINSNLKTIKKDIVEAIEIARHKLIDHPKNQRKDAYGLVDFSATLVGVFCHHNCGIFFHIGDGAGLSYVHDNTEKFIISEPENGTFSCETYFYTMMDWQNFLRFTPFENMDRIMLMTDGVTGFVFSDDFYKIHRNFLIPIISYLEKEPRKTYACQALTNTLDDARARRLNADDKTILWAKLK